MNPSRKKDVFKPPKLFYFLFFMLFPNLIYGQNCFWDFINEQDCEHWIAPGFACDTANQNRYADFLLHHHTANPMICEFPYTTCGSWSSPSSGIIYFDCGYCGQTPQQNCTNVSALDAKYYIRVNTILSIGVDQLAFDWRTVDKFLIDFQEDLPDTYCCDLTSSPDACVSNNCSAPEIEWEDKEIFLHGAYQPYYQNCINWP